jgi:glycosyltransferase involved in cell wall biosynthesis
MKRKDNFKYEACYIGFLMGDGIHYGGQETKTTSILNQLYKHYGDNLVFFVNTYGWKKRPIVVFFQFLKGAAKSRRIILSTAHKGIKVFSWLLNISNLFFHRELYCAVVGGWLPGMLKKKRVLKKRLKKYHGIFVETNVMLLSLKEQGLHNVFLLRNVRNSPIVSPLRIRKPDSTIRFCVFSRIDEKKGIEDAVFAIKSINESNHKKECVLALYGGIQDEYKQRFEQLEASFPSYVTYRGLIAPESITEALLNYDVLLFPTHYDTEGFPGTILDAMLNGLIIISKDIPSTREILGNKDFAFLYPSNTYASLESAISQVLSMSSEELFRLKIASLSESEKYNFEKAFSVFFNVLDKIPN